MLLCTRIFQRASSFSVNGKRGCPRLLSGWRAWASAGSASPAPLARMFPPLPLSGQRKKWEHFWAGRAVCAGAARETGGSRWEQAFPKGLEISLTTRGRRFLQAVPKAGRKVSSSRLPPRSARDGRHWRPSPFSKVAGFGTTWRSQRQESRGLALDRKGGAIKSQREATLYSYHLSPIEEESRAAREAEQ